MNFAKDCMNSAQVVNSAPGETNSAKEHSILYASIFKEEKWETWRSFMFKPEVVFTNAGKLSSLQELDYKVQILFINLLNLINNNNY